MNSVLQCFSNIFELTNYFLNPSKEQIIKNNTITMGKENENEKVNSLSVAYKEVIDKLWKGEPNKPFSPNKFKKMLGELNSLFKDENAGDSKDFACFLIMQLHKELNNIDHSLANKQNQFYDKNITINPYDKNQVFQYFLNDFAINHSSIISNLFYGVNQSMYECQVCKQNINNNMMIPLIKYNYENFFYLEFPLDEVRKHVALKNNMGMYYQNINEVNILDCFYYGQKQNDLDGYCDRCQSDNAKILNVTQIFSSPNVLMIIFNRGKGLQFNIKINFSEILDLSKIVIINNPIYELQGVIKHLGDSSASGHFIAYCRSPIPKFHNCWYCYNDQTVVEIKDLKSIHDVGDTYILFYQLKNNKK